MASRYTSSSKNKVWGLLAGYHSTNFNSADPSTNLALAMNDGTYDLEHKQAWADFDRFYAVDLPRELPSGRHYIFICRPDLYLVEEGSGVNGTLNLSADSRVNVDPYFSYLAEFHPEIIASLTHDFAGVSSGNYKYLTKPLAIADKLGYVSTTDGTTVKVGKTSYKLPLHSFIPYLTSRVESLPLPDYTIKQNTIVQPYTKYTIPYTTSAIESSTGGSFDITFREDKDYSIHKLFYGWVYYQNNVMRNIFKPRRKYILDNELDYATSIYDFIVDDTGENIVYWAKYTGCVPTSVSMSDLSFTKGNPGETKISVPFSYFFCEHMDRNILMDFQYNSLGYLAMTSYFANNAMNPFPISNTIPIYDSDTFLGRNLVGRPVIYYGEDSIKGKVFKLRWLP